MFDRFRTRLWKLLFRVHPAYRGTGGRVTHIAPDWSEVRVEVPHSWRTKNYMGTIFGGSLYGAVDPIYAMMLIKRLGDDYVVWDKEATIQFKKPGTETLTATFELPDDELAAVKNALDGETDSIDREYTVDLVDDAGTTCATVQKTIHVSTDASKKA
mgnify:FL=1